MNSWGVPGAPVRSVQWPESSCHASSELRARSQMPQALPDVHLPAWRYRNSGHHPPIHVIFMAAIGRVLPSPSRFCIVEAPAKEWSFNDAPVPWILPAGYRNPNEKVPDFPEDDEAGSLDKGGSVPLTGLSAEVTTVDDAEEEDDEFVVVGDAEEESGDKVVISISAKEVAKPKGSGLPGKTIMFESDESDDDPEVKKQIEAVLDRTDLLGELILSDESESESSDGDDDEDLDETKQYYKDQEEGIGESGSKLISRKAVNTDPAAVPESAGNPTNSKPDAPSRNTPPAKPGYTKGKGASSECSGKAPAPKLQLSAAAQGVQEHA